MKSIKRSNKSSSRGERKIEDILRKEKIIFEREKAFSDGERVANYRFDFYLPRYNICIEFQGRQHMEFIPFFYKTVSDFKKAQERDRQKISYCLANNIKLYCIPFWELDNLNSFKDIVQEKFFAKTKFHNDQAWRMQLNQQKYRNHS